MTPAQYRQALTTLSLTPDQAAEWLGIGRSTAYRYLTEGAPGPVARCLRMAVALMGLDRCDVEECGPVGRGWFTGVTDPDGEYVRHSDLTAAVGLGG